MLPEIFMDGNIQGLKHERHKDYQEVYANGME